MQGDCKEGEDCQWRARHVPLCVFELLALMALDGHLRSVLGLLDKFLGCLCELPFC